MSDASTKPEAPVHVGRVTMYPIIAYDDAPAAIAWLQRVFAFAPLMIMTGDGGEIGHAELRLGDGVIMPTTRQRTPDPENPWRQPLGAQGLYVALDSVDAHYEHAVQAGAEIVRPLADTDYGSREYSARDLEGNLWSFGTYRPDVSG
ncbi:MAG: VOC family protein [Thermomicrobiales bacterium]|nr:VOC family protein [Thermomicrobiales bacterium]MCA9880557.1 VOC family protein [Thermomicrobiales bacterium]